MLPALIRDLSLLEPCEVGGVHAGAGCGEGGVGGGGGGGCRPLGRSLVLNQIIFNKSDMFYSCAPHRTALLLLLLLPNTLCILLMPASRRSGRTPASVCFFLGGGFERPSEEEEEEEQVGRVARGAAVSSCDCKYSEGDVRDGARAALGLLLYLLIHYFHPLKVRCVKFGFICDSYIGKSLTYRPKSV